MIKDTGRCAVIAAKTEAIFRITVANDGAANLALTGVLREAHVPHVLAALSMIELALKGEASAPVVRGL